MKKFAFAIIAAVAMAVSACSTFENYKAPEEKFPNCVGCYGGG